MGSPTDFAESPRRLLVSSGHAALAADAGNVAGLRVLAASIAGREHLSRDLAREDAYAWRLTDTPRAPVGVFAVSDGVSAGTRSQTFSLALVLESVDALATLPAMGLVTAEELRGVGERAVHREAAVLAGLGMDAVHPRSQRRRSGQAATLALAAVEPTPQGLDVTWCQIGDTWAGSFDPRAGTTTWFAPYTGGDGHYVFSLPSDPDQVIANRVLVPTGCWLLIATDGMVALLEDHGQELAAVLIGDRDDLTTTASLLGVLSAKVDDDWDDRTVLLVGTGTRAPA